MSHPSNAAMSMAYWLTQMGDETALADCRGMSLMVRPARGACGPALHRGFPQGNLSMAADAFA